MKKQMLFLILGISMVNCQNQKAENPPLAPTEVIAPAEVVNKTPTATNSLNYLGTYKGTLPCADCSGVETSLELTEDFNYTLTTKYKGKSDKPVETKGTFRWSNDETSIVLENIKNAPNRFLVADNSLTQLDMSGKKIEGKLASNYILKKIPEAEAAKIEAKNNDAISDQQNTEIVGVHWNLTEINGRAIKTDDPKGYFMELKPDNNFKAYAGCNNMAGHYEYRGERIHFMRIVGTMKACPNPTAEEEI
ncbi:MAG: META domain-containing protein, partial [Flavobacterium sp.]